MKKIGKILPLSLVILLIIVFFLSVKPLTDYDLWFHLKSGEIIAKMGLIRYDVFSHTAQGREWYPYEWLFQIFVYYFSRVFGFEPLKIITGTFAALLSGTGFLILRKVFKTSSLVAFTAAFFLFAGVYEFIVLRPHIVAYTLLVISLYLILDYFQNNRNRLILLLPVTLIWGNLHGSIFLLIYLLVAYAGISLGQFLILKKTEMRKKAIIMGIFSLLCGIFSILPPLGITQYRLLWNFFLERELLSKFIDEWAPLSASMPVLIFTTIEILVILAFLVLAVIKSRKFVTFFFVLPLLPFLAVAYSYSRNLFLLHIASSIILGYSGNTLIGYFTGKGRKAFQTGFIILVFGFSLFLLSEKMKAREERILYPEKAVDFIKKVRPQGNMFNEYGFGGYLLYRLYPEVKVFYDGRSDVFLCCEIKETLGLSLDKNLPDDRYKATIDKLFDNHNISFVLISTPKHTVLRKISRVLNDNSKEWSLVYFDDISQIFVKKNGLNDNLISTYGLKFVTPYNQDPYLAGHEDEALVEYQKMEAVTDSAKSRNASGFLLLKKKMYPQAKTEFEKAVLLDPYFESPYMNLAELAVRDGDYALAIKDYQKAQSLASDRGLVYIRMGQIYLEGWSDKGKAREIWEFGLKETVDDDAKGTLRKLLEGL